MKIDTCWINGKIHTINPKNEIVEAIATFENKIVALGTSENILELVQDETIIYDLKGKNVFPGFIDSHVHFQMFGQTLTTLNIRDKSKKEILDLVKDAAKDLNEGEWIVGGMGWNNEVWDDPSYPTKEELDLVSPHNPVLLPRMDGHMIWINSKAFEVANVDKDTPNPIGGEYMRNEENNELLGCASNSASTYIKSFLPEITKKERQEAILKAQEKLFYYGVTSVSELNATLQNLLDFEELYKLEKLKIRISASIDSKELEKDDEYKNYYELCPIIGKYNGKYDVRSIKFLADGSVGAQSAAQYEDYTDRPGHKGEVFYSKEEQYNLVKRYAKHGMQVITHAIGDKTIDQVIDIYSKVIDELKLTDHRFRIEHFQLVRGNSLQKTKDNGIFVSMQPTHGPNSASMALRRLGKDRSKHAYAVGEVLNVMEEVALGSDAPVAQPDPIDGIHSAVTRKNSKLEPSGGFFLENAITVDQAIKGYTIWGAKAQFNDNVKGTIEINKFADFVILNKNLNETNSDDILDIKILATVIAGEIVYKDPHLNLNVSKNS